MVITLVVTLMFVVGVKVAVQLRPPSLDATALRVPFATVRSALLKPVTASLNVIVTAAVSPAARLMSATPMLAVGRVLSTSKVGLSVVPNPLLPARSTMPPLSRVMTLLATVLLAVGVSVAVQVMPPSPVLRFDREAFGALRSAAVKPLIASVKVMVTVAVSPIFRAVSLRVMLEAKLGRTVSTA